MNREQHPRLAAWDAIEPSSLPILAGVRKMSNRFGTLFRHYWTPATELEYVASTVRLARDGKSDTSTCNVVRNMVRCEADRCQWRQRETGRLGRDGIGFEPENPVELLCEYDRSRQTFRTKKPLEFDFEPSRRSDATIRAFLHQPILTPLLPVPTGFTWHVKTEQGYMEFHVTSFETVGDMPVVHVRRKGVFRLDRFYRNGTAVDREISVAREGVTAYALDRSLVLEDRTRDILTGHHREIDGLESRTTWKLIRSSAAENPMAPLITKYRTANAGYLYDGGSGHIVKVDDDVYDFVDDWGVLTNDEIREKYRTVEPAKRDAAFRVLAELRQGGVLSSHQPCELSKVEIVYHKKKENELAEFWRRTGMLLVLGITERCNLCCSYCCYGGKFAGQRTHSSRSMRWETAEKALTNYLDGEPFGDATCPITFYGGEPLLETHLVRKCVRYAMERAEFRRKKVRFSITTNGTLLDDETVDFLVENDFLVLVSIDGPKEVQDRYRTFADGGGSFDLVVDNLRRFAKRYPEYKNRGLSMTLAPPFDLEATSKFVDEFFPDYPLSRTDLVNVGSEFRFVDQPESATRYGCVSCSSCSKRPGAVDAFRHFAPEDREQLISLRQKAMASIADIGAMKSWEIMPLAMMIFENQMLPYHRRPVLDRPPEWSFFIPCLPGFTRRFCDVDGNYRVCERIDESNAWLLGNVRTGLDSDRMERTMELRRHFGDCGNCIALKVCDLCYARIPDSDAAESGYDPQFDLQCQKMREAATGLLAEYTGIMEKNADAFEKPVDRDAEKQQSLRFGSPGSRLSAGIRKRLESETAWS